MHKPLIIELPNLTSIASCTCDFQGTPRIGDRATNNAAIDSLAHFESSIKDEWAREASVSAIIRKCPLCKTAMNYDDEFPDYVDCKNHHFLIQESASKVSVLKLEADHSYSGQMALDITWNYRCPVINCPGLFQGHRESAVGDHSCSNGHEFTTETIYPFVYCELII